jgi:putative transposase
LEESLLPDILVSQVDNSGAHTCHQINLPDNIQLLFQPPYAPELNPIERLWKFIMVDC